MIANLKIAIYSLFIVCAWPPLSTFRLPAKSFVSCIINCQLQSINSYLSAGGTEREGVNSLDSSTKMGFVQQCHSFVLIIFVADLWKCLQWQDIWLLHKRLLLNWSQSFLTPDYCCVWALFSLTHTKRHFLNWHLCPLGPVFCGLVGRCFLAGGWWQWFYW